MTLSINEAVLGITSQDILWELRTEELGGPAADPNLLSRLSRHLIEQRHWLLPLFLPADRETSYQRLAPRLAYLQGRCWM